MRERLIRFACRLYPASWRHRYEIEFEALLQAFGLAGALLCGPLSFIAVPDKYTSDCTLRLTKSLFSGDPQPATDNTEEFVCTHASGRGSRWKT
jgi:hypothetical protein